MRRGHLKIVLSIALAAFFPVLPNHLCNYGEHFCGIILNLEHTGSRGNAD